jgi:hypothetical protein
MVPPFLPHLHYRLLHFLRKLLEAGGRADALEKDDVTPLHLAAKGESGGAEEGGGAGEDDGSGTVFVLQNCPARWSAVESVQKTALKVAVFCHPFTGT